MKPIIQKLPLAESTSFVARTYRTPDFEVPWHQHVEYELILFTEGAGLSFIGNYVGEFETGDVFFLGTNLPHTFQKRDKELVTSAVVVQFRDDFWGRELLDLPECRTIRDLLAVARHGLRLRAGSRQLLQPLLTNLEYATGFERILQLGNCLALLARQADYDLLSTQEIRELNPRYKERIDAIFQYTIESFQQAITLADVAQRADLSVPAFCAYFKKSTKKTYIDFLNEIRIGYACQRLRDSTEPITRICYEAGFNTLANFNKQFLKKKGRTPSRYRRAYARINL